MDYLGFGYAAAVAVGGIIGYAKAGDTVIFYFNFAYNTVLHIVMDWRCSRVGYRTGWSRVELDWTLSAIPTLTEA